MAAPIERPESSASPANYQQLVDLYFIENRAKSLDLAAFLDRLDRAVPQPQQDDFRVAALRQAIEILNDGKPNRAARILSLLSDHSTDPIDSASGLKGAFGACPPPGDPTS